MKIKQYLSEQLLCGNRKYMIGYKRGCLIIRRSKDRSLVCMKRIHARFKSVELIERLFRYEPRAAVSMNDDTFIFSLHGYIYEYQVSSNIITKKHCFKKGMNNPLTFCVRRDEEGEIADILYGEYIWNTENGPVSIYRKQGEKWKKVYSFSSNTIKHIHNIFYDKYKNRYIILTGDDDKESGIWQADIAFNHITPLVKGKQQYRACVAWPTADGIYYATDTPLEINWIYKLVDNQSEVSVKKIYELPGPCIFGRAKETDMYFATSVEGDPNLGGWRYRLSNKLGKGVKDRYVHIIKLTLNGSVKEICKFQKDKFPMWLFQFGNAKFPCTSDEKIYICPQSTKDRFKTYVIEE